VAALLFAAWPLALLPLAAGAAAVCGGAMLAGGGLLLARRRLGGHTGDILGGVEQLGEIGFLLGAAAVLA
jgi:adenosylcobinamide-GDP ribazoletransferase